MCLKMKFILRHCYNRRFKRFYSNKRKPNTNPYFASLYLPKTSLPKTIPLSKQVESEIIVQKNSNFLDLYSWQKKLSDRPKFTMLVAPTMASDQPQMEQVTSNIFADIINRYKLLQGYKIHYQPGWHYFNFLSDSIKSASSNEEYNKLRQTVKAENEAIVERQKTAFRQWGIMANWKDCHILRNECGETQIKIFWDLYEKGLIFRDLRPVYWSPSLRTALAESDLEYVNNHKSSSIYLRIPLCKFPSLSDSVCAAEQIYALIWTTTPWMLPSSETIWYSESINYSLVQCENTKCHYLIASNLRKKLEQHFSTKFIVKNSFEGKALENSTFLHPFRKRQLLLLHADYVNSEKGTGLVIGNPSHYLDDYEIGKKYNLPIVSDLVDENGLFTEKAGSLLEGKHIFGKGSEAILATLENNILSQQTIMVPHLYDQYRKNPVIVRPSLQWFLNIGRLKDKVLDCLEKTKIIPNYLINSLKLLLEKNSPFWCISRQNIFGVPIPVFYDKTNQKPIVNRKLIDYWCKLFQEHGSSIWWTLSEKDLIPSNILNKDEISMPNELVKGTDVLIPQFDAGVHWKFILEDSGNIADMCVSGLDQNQGWLQMCLFTSAVLQSKSPSQHFLIHGLTTKERKRKLPKSLKSLIDHWNIANDPKQASSGKAFGADTLRWWTATSALATEDGNIQGEDTMLEDSSADVRKIRMILWFLLGNLRDFKEEHLVDYCAMKFVDKYFLHLLSEFQSEILTKYSDCAFDDVASMILNFIIDDVSNVYLQAVKERLFSGKRDGLARRSSQTCNHFLLHHLTYAVAPILPHLAEEVYHHNPMHKNDSLFRTLWTDCPKEWQDKELQNTMDAIVSIKSLVDKIAGSSARRSAEITIRGPSSLLKMLKPLHSDVRSSYSDLPDMLEVADVKLIDMPLDESSNLFKGLVKLPKETFQIQLQASPTNYSKCGRCCRFVADNTDVCIQCSHTKEDEHKEDEKSVC